MSQVNLLEFNVKVLRFLNLWPRKNGVTHGIWRALKDFFLVFYVAPSFMSVTIGLYYELLDENRRMSSITETLISIMCCIGMFYVIVCFVRNRDDIIKLVDQLKDFEEFGKSSDLLKTDREAAMLTGIFLIYGLIGTLVYASMPFVSIQYCEANKSHFMKEVGIPCGLVITKFFLPFEYDFSPRREIVAIYQVTICITFSTTVSALSLLLCGLLMHIRMQLKYLGKKLASLTNSSTEEIFEDVKICVQFHTAIILYAKKTNEAFNSMMMLHITVTSIVISILGYQVLLTDNYTDSLRYGLHLGGWLSVLFLVCYNGQNLIDESTAIARTAYFSAWFNFPASVQRDILLIIARAQRPLTLTALNFGTMSLATFLQVMSTAYSYFTLLAKMRS